ncbi:MAG: pectate lyase, partial [Bacteroidales bacterium]
MKYSIRMVISTLVIVILNTVSFTAKSQPLAFPGADGYGKYVTGGRGGVVYEVTNLKDDGLPGSLRYAINQSGARTIVFRVSGTIALSSTLTISNGDLTIAGQTAPGDGICLKNHQLRISASNVIIRYLRIRLGENWGADALGGFSPKNSAGSGSLPIKNIIIDHCSVSYGCDETLSIYDIENLTVQWCIISESLNKEGHGFGGIMGGWGGSLHHNVFAHHKNRSPRFCGARYQFNLQNELVDMRNNVIYNAGKTYGGEGGHYNVVNNYYKRGSSEFLNPSQPNPSETDNEFVGCVYDSIKSYWYVTGNYIYNNAVQTADNWTGGVKFNYPPLNIRVYNPFPSAYIGPEETAEEAFINVCRGAGATLPKRDTIDTRVISDVINNTGTVPLTLANIPGEAFPTLNSLPAPTDTDQDGMPNDWEIANGLDTNNAADRNNIAADGYTMLEKYL